ncbi:hypothetical protein AMQ83_34500 [Paenibacillus riograndensis]|nr:hypothetical protein AMQ83_34500 [Paenibacillus riograndensis]
MWSTIVSYIPGWVLFMQATITLLCPLGIYFIYKKLYSFASSAGPKLNAISHPNAVSTAESLVSGRYEADLSYLQQAIGGNSDVNFREFVVKGYEHRAVLAFVDGMQDEALINRHVMQLLMSGNGGITEEKQNIGKH